MVQTRGGLLPERGDSHRIREVWHDGAGWRFGWVCLKLELAVIANGATAQAPINFLTPSR